MTALRVAWHEARHLRRIADRRVGPAVLAMAVLLAAVAPMVLREGVQPDAGLFPVSGDGPLAEAADEDARFRAASDDAVLHIGDAVAHDPADPRSVAALHALDDATSAWLDRRMAQEADEAAALPVRIDMALEPRRPSAEEAVPTGPGTPGDGAGTAGNATGDTPEPPGDAEDGVLTDVAGVREGLRPHEVEPPFPIRSLLLAFAYMIPMNFVAQMQAGALMTERIRRRGVLLLSAPLRPATILTGRMLPYLALSALVWTVAGIAIRTDAAGWAAALTIVAFVHATGVLVGLLARSEREVSLLLTGLTTGVSTFLFLPAVFTALPPVAFLSPVSVVAAGIRGETVGWAAFTYATVPLALMTVAVGAVGYALYREETLFSPRPLLAKAGDALERLVRRRWWLAVAGVLLVPWAFTLELFWVGIVIPLGLAAAFPLIVVGAAFVEEALKAWIGVRHRIASGRGALGTGLIVGTAFWAGERLAFVLVLMNFPALELGSQTVSLFGIGSLATALVPLAVHVAAAVASASGALAGRTGRRLAYLGAATIHAVHNTVAVLVVGP